MNILIDSKNIIKTRIAEENLRHEICHKHLIYKESNENKGNITNGLGEIIVYLS
jgi:hypothetical protein